MITLIFIVGSVASLFMHKFSAVEIIVGTILLGLLDTITFYAGMSTRRGG